MPIISNFPMVNSEHTAVQAHEANQEAHSGKINNSLVATTATVSSSNLITVSAIKGISSYSELPDQFSLLIPSVTAQSESDYVTLKLLGGSTVFNVSSYAGSQLTGSDVLAGAPMLLVINKSTGVVILASSGGSSSSPIASNRCIIEFSLVNSSSQNVDFTDLQVTITSDQGSETAYANESGKVIFDVVADNYEVTVNGLAENVELQSFTMPSAAVLGGNQVSVTLTIIDNPDYCTIEFSLVNSSSQTVDFTQLKVSITGSSVSDSAYADSNGKVVFNLLAEDFEVTVENMVDKTQLQEFSMPSAATLKGTRTSITLTIIDKLVVTQGFIIDTSNSDPAGAITYCDDSVGMTAGSIAWMDVWPFNAIYPCTRAYNAGAGTITKASRNNPLQDESGNTLSTADGTNHFVVFPLMWIKFTALSSTQYKVQITDTEPSESGWMRYPYDTTYNATAIGRYEGSYSSSRLGSRPSQTVKVSATRANFRTYAKANTGAGHTLVDFDMETIMETLYLLYFKTFDSQTAIGQGYTNSNNSAAIKTGTMDSKNTGSVASHLYGDQTGTTGMKFLWVENWFGNTWEFVDGINIISYVAYICHVIANYADDTTTNYTNAGTVLSTSGQYPKRGLYTNNGRFLPSESGGSSATYYSDYYWVNSGNRVALFGGGWIDGAYAGAFCWYLLADSSGSHSDVSGRLGCYLQLDD